MTSSHLPQGSLILVTGANGFISSHIIDILLQLGYRVRGTVRNVEKAQWLVDLMKKRHPEGHLELAHVEDFTKEGCFDHAAKGCSGFVHAASDLSFSPNPNDIVPPVLASINHALNAAAKEPGMKSFLYTSSSTAATNPYPNKKFHISNDTWNDKAVEDAWAPPPYERSRAWAVYGASKMQGEKEVWKWAEENKPSFKVNTILPNANFGEILDPANQSASTASWILAVAGGNFEKVRSIPPQYFVNVKDTAKLHAALVTDVSYDRERIFAFAEPYNWNKIFAISRRLRPDLDIPADIEDNSEDLSTVDNASALDILNERYGQNEWTGLEESLKANLEAVPRK